MSSITQQRAVLAPQTGVRVVGAELPALATAVALTAGAAWIGSRWWERAAIVPVSWALPAPEALFLLPGAVVLALLALRLVVAGRRRTVASQHLLTMASRWSVGWAAATGVWLLVTTARLYGGVDGLAGADNIAVVLSSSTEATSRLTVVWVALLVALFGPRLGGWRETLGLLALAGTALVAAVPFVGSNSHLHGAAPLSPVVPAVAAVQVLALAVALGALAAIPHLQTPAYQLRMHLTRFGDLVSGATLVLGTAAVLAGVLLVDRPTPPAMAVAQLAAVGLVATVGYRHRRRVVDVVSARRGPALVALAAGELVVLVAVVLMASWLPVGSW